MQSDFLIKISVMQNYKLFRCHVFRLSEEKEAEATFVQPQFPGPHLLLSAAVTLFLA